MRTTRFAPLALALLLAAPLAAAPAGCPAISVSPATLADGATGQSYGPVAFSASPAGTYTFEATGLPNGLGISPAGSLSGTPTQKGTFVVRTVATDANGCVATHVLPLNVACGTITVTNPSTTSGPVNVFFSQQFTQTGASGTPSFSTTSTLPNGLTLSSSGLLSGTPTQSGPFPIVVKVTDSNGCTGTGSTYNLSICPTISVTNPATTSGTAGVAFSVTFTQSGGSGTITWSESGALPTGITLDPATGVLSGTTSQTGSFPITVTATDQNGCTGTGSTYTLTIVCPTITVGRTGGGTFPNATYNVAYAGESFAASGSNGTPYGFTVTGGTFPPGLNLATSGAITGTPTATGVFSFTVTATDQYGCTGTAGASITVAPSLTAKSYTAVGNTQLLGGAAPPSTPYVAVTGVGTGDASDTAISYAVTVPPANGTLTIFNSDGTFLYTPNAGNRSADSFTYTGTSNGATATQTATIAFNGMVWWVNSALGAGDGRSNLTFNSMSGVAGASTAAGDTIFVYQGSGNTAGAYTMLASQRLIGQGTAATYTVGGGILTLPTLSGAYPTLGGTLTLANAVVVDGIDMSTGTSDGISNTGAAATGISVIARNVTASSGTPVNIIPSSGTVTGTLTFQSVSANGGTKGIVLHNSAATFTVNGTGTTAGSGGTIQAKTNNGVELVNAANVTLKNMNLTGNAQSQTSPNTSCGNNMVSGDTTLCVANLYMNIASTVSLTNLSVTGSTQIGIAGTSVNGFTLANSTVSGNGNELYEDGLLFKNLSGACAISNTLVRDNFYGQSYVDNGSGALTLTVAGSTFGRTSAPGVSSSHGLLLVLRNSSTAAVDVGTSSFTQNGNGNGLQINVNDSAALGTSTTHSSLHDSPSLTFNAAHVYVNTSTGGHAFFDVLNNPSMTLAGLQSIDFFASGTSSAANITGVVQGNTIGTSGVSGSACNFAVTGGGCDGMDLDQAGAATMNVRVQANTIQQFLTNGIESTTTQSGNVNASFTNNTIQQPAGGANQGNAMLLNVGPASGSTATACLNIATNSIFDDASSPYDPFGSLAAIFVNTANSVVTRLPGYVGAPTDDTAATLFITGQNTFGLQPADSPAFAQTFNGSAWAGGPACSVP